MLIKPDQLKLSFYCGCVLPNFNFLILDRAFNATYALVFSLEGKNSLQICNGTVP